MELFYHSGQKQVPSVLGFIPSVWCPNWPRNYSDIPIGNNFVLYKLTFHVASFHSKGSEAERPHKMASLKLD